MKENLILLLVAGYILLCGGCAMTPKRPLLAIYDVPAFKVIVAEPYLIRAAYRGKIPQGYVLHGFYDASNQTIFVEYNSRWGTQPNIKTLGHEVGHIMAGQAWYR